MTTLQALIRKILSLPPDKQEQVLAYAESISKAEEKQPRKPLESIEGLTADIPCNLSFEEFQQNRREMWGTSTDRELDR